MPTNHPDENVPVSPTFSPGEAHAASFVRSAARTVSGGDGFTLRRPVAETLDQMLEELHRRRQPAPTLSERIGNALRAGIPEGGARAVPTPEEALASVRHALLCAADELIIDETEARTLEHLAGAYRTMLDAFPAESARALDEAREATRRLEDRVGRILDALEAAPLTRDGWPAGLGQLRYQLEELLIDEDRVDRDHIEHLRAMDGIQ